MLEVEVADGIFIDLDPHTLVFFTYLSKVLAAEKQPQTQAPENVAAPKTCNKEPSAPVNIIIKQVQISLHLSAENVMIGNLVDQMLSADSKADPLDVLERSLFNCEQYEQLQKLPPNEENKISLVITDIQGWMHQ